jgi:hypothetical protein
MMVSGADMMISKVWFVLEERMAAPSHPEQWINIASGNAESVMITDETVKHVILL